MEDHVDPTDKKVRRIIPEYVERGVFRFHTRNVAMVAGTRQTTSPVPFSDGLLSLERAVCRRYGQSTVSRFDLPPSIVDQLDALQLVAVGGGGGAGVRFFGSRFISLGSCHVQVRNRRFN